MATKAQQIHEQVTALVNAGMTKAEAFKQLATESGRPVDSLRGAYYSAQRGAPGAGGTSRPRSRKRETTIEDAVASAVASLHSAIDSIELELETGRERAEEATAEYEAMKAATGGRIEEIRAKIAILDPEGDDPPPLAASTEPSIATPTDTTGAPAKARPATRREVKGA